MKGRKSNFELLRIIAMCMIIAMHYMTKGMHLPKLSVDASLSNHLWWLFYGLCLVSPNAYVLISGYFLSEKWSTEWNWKAYVAKGINILAEVLFYSWLVPVTMVLFGIVTPDQIDFYTKITVLLPISEEHYWFATSYLLMYLISPALSVGLKKMDKVQHQCLMATMVVILSGIKTVCPYLLPTDHYGCDVFWFVGLFVIAAYIRKYGIPFIKNMKMAILLYFGTVLLYMGECAFAAMLVRKTGRLEYFMDMIYSYNHILVLIASIAFFGIFMFIDESIDRYKISTLIAKGGTHSFGVYLLHENLVVRERWFIWLGIENVSGQWYQFLHMLLCVCIVLIVGVFVDIIRSSIWKLVKRK